MMRNLLAAVAALWIVAPAAQAATLELEYEASILNVVALGRLNIAGSIGGTTYALTGAMQTTGFAQLFDDTRISVQSAGTVATGALGWSRYALNHAYARKSRRVEMTRSSGGVSARITPVHQNMGTPRASAAQQNASFDPLSAVAALSLGVGRAGACTGTYLVFDGREHYSLALTPGSRGTYKGGGYDGPAVVCNLTYTPISGFKPMTAQERARIPRAQAWFAETPTGGFSQLLRIAVPTPVGEGRIDLKRMTLTP